MIESAFTVSDDDQASGVEIPDLETQLPLGDLYGDPDEESNEWKSPLHTGELPYINLLLWRAIQKVLHDLYLCNRFDDDLEVGEKRVQSRLLKSDALAVTWFISSGKLEQLTKTTKRLFKARGKDVDEEDLRLELCFRFLSRLRKKSREEASFLNPLLPTVGIELEYGMLNDPDTGNTFKTTAYQERTNRLKPLLRAYDEKWESDECGELSLKPTASQITQLRDVLHLAELKHHPHLVFSPHITIGGLAITKEHREPQFIQVLLLACGFSQLSTDLLKLREENGFRSVRFTDYMQKRSHLALSLGDTKRTIEYYVPFLKLRHPEKGQIFGDDVDDYKLNNDDQRITTEFRLGQFIFGFADLVREVSGIYYLSIAAMAHQKPIAERNQLEHELAELWVETQSRLTTMIEESGIQITKSIEESFFSSERSDFYSDRATILIDMVEISYQSRQQEVRSKYRRLLTETKLRIKTILKKENS